VMTAAPLLGRGDLCGPAFQEGTTMLQLGRSTTLANWQDAPFNRWGFLHVDQILPTVPIERGGASRSW